MRGLAARRSCLVVACVHSNMKRVTWQLPNSLAWCRKARGLMGEFGGLVWADLEEFHMPRRTSAKKPEQPCVLLASHERGDYGKIF